MTEFPAVANMARAPSHPGETLADILLDSHDVTREALAAALAITDADLGEILTGRSPVTPETAARLGKFFGAGPGIWLRIQTAHDAWHSR